MNDQCESMLRPTNAVSVRELLREFIPEARNVQTHLAQISEACSKELNRQHA